jgi:hypothetical protein
MDAVVAAAQAGSDWVLRPRPLHNSVCVRQLSTNAVQLWRAMDEDLPVPPPLTHQPPVTLVVWRKGLQPHFQTTDPLAGRLLGALLLGLSISDACAALVEEGHLQDPASVGSCLAAWLEMGLLHADPVLEAV